MTQCHRKKDSSIGKKLIKKLKCQEVANFAHCINIQH